MRARLPSKYFRSAIITWSHKPACFRSVTRYSFTTVNSPDRFDFTNRFWKVGSIDADTPTILAMVAVGAMAMQLELRDRKSTRLNSSHSQISYAVFCLKKKK